MTGIGMHLLSHSNSFVKTKFFSKRFNEKYCMNIFPQLYTYVFRFYIVQLNLCWLYSKPISMSLKHLYRQISIYIYVTYTCTSRTEYEKTMFIEEIKIIGERTFYFQHKQAKWKKFIKWKSVLLLINFEGMRIHSTRVKKSSTYSNKIISYKFREKDEWNLVKKIMSVNIKKTFCTRILTWSIFRLVLIIAHTHTDILNSSYKNQNKTLHIYTNTCMFLQKNL